MRIFMLHKNMFKKVIGIFMLIGITTFLASCDKYVAPILFKPSGEVPSKFPATVNVNYYVANNVENLYGKDKDIIFHVEGIHDILKVFPVKKTKEGYIIISSDDENYAIPNPSKFGYSDVYHLNEKNGHFSIKVDSLKEYNSLFSGIPDGLDEVFTYYHCYTHTPK